MLLAAATDDRVGHSLCSFVLPEAAKVLAWPIGARVDAP